MHNVSYERMETSYDHFRKIKRLITPKPEESTLRSILDRTAASWRKQKKNKAYAYKVVSGRQASVDLNFGPRLSVD